MRLTKYLHYTIGYITNYVQITKLCPIFAKKMSKCKMYQMQKNVLSYVSFTINNNNSYQERLIELKTMGLTLVIFLSCSVIG